MKPLHEYIHQNLRKNKKRALLSVLSVAFAMAFLFTMMTFTKEIYESFQTNIIRTNGNYHVLFKNADEQLQSLLKHHYQVSNILKSQNFGYSIIGSKNQERPYLKLVGVDDAALDNLDFQLSEGRFPMNDGELVISWSLLNDAKVNLDIGSYVTLNFGQRIDGYGDRLSEDTELVVGEKIEGSESRTFQVVGVMEPLKSDANHPYYTALTYYQELDGYPLDLYVQYKDINDTVSNTEKIKYYNEGHFSRVKYNERLLAYTNFYSDNTAMIQVVAVVLISFLVFLIMVLLMIYSSFVNLYRNREKHLAIFKTIGATQSQIRHMIFYEGFLILLIGIPLGICIGVVFSAICFHLMDGLFFVDWHMSLYSLFTNAWVGMLVSGLTTLLMSYFAMHVAFQRASLQSISMTLSSNDEVIDSPGLQMKRKRLKVWQRLLLKNLKQNHKSYRKIKALMVVFLVFIFVTQGFLRYSKQGASAYLNEVNYDVKVSFTSDSYPTSLMSRLKLLEFYDSMMISEQIFIDIDQVKGINGELSKISESVVVSGVDASALNEYLAMQQIPSEAEDDFDLSNGIQALAYNVANVEDKEIAVFEGDEIWIDFGNERLKVGLRMLDDPLMGMKETSNINLVVSNKVMHQLIKQLDLEQLRYTVYYCTNDDKQLVKQLNLLSMGDRVDDLEIVNEKIMIQNSSSQIRFIFMIVTIYSFLLMLVVMMISLNTLSINFEYRKKELILYRMIGLRMRTVFGIVLSELWIYAVQIYGVAFLLAIILHAVLQRFTDIRFSMEDLLQVNVLLGIASCLFAICLLIAVYVYGHIKKSKYDVILQNDIFYL